MAEWSNAAVLKTVVVQATGGSNPSLSAENKDEGLHKSLQKVIQSTVYQLITVLFYFCAQQGGGLNVGSSLQSSVIICYIYCYTLKTPQINVAVTEK